MTFQDRVEALVGTVADAAPVDAALLSCARMLVNMLPPEMALQYATNVNITSPGLTVEDTYRILSVKAGNYPAVEVDPGLSGALSASGSLFYATAICPKYYIKNGKLTVLPVVAGTEAIVVGYPNVGAADTPPITHFPQSLTDALTYYAAIQVLYNRLQVARAALVDVTITIPGVDTLPTLPSALSLSWSDYTLPTFDASVFETLTNVPEYTPPTLSLATELNRLVTYLATQEDIELTMAQIADIRSKLEIFQSQMASEMNTVQTTSTLYRTEFEKQSQELQLAQQRLAAVYQSTIDIGMKNKLQTLQVEVDSFQSALAVYNAGVQGYAILVSTEMQRVQSLVQQILSTFKAAGDMIAAYRAEFDKILLMNGLLQSKGT
jgi:DNA-binding transcriptional regulator YiaG